VLDEVNWLSTPLAVGDSCGVQARYRSKAVPARISAISSSGLTLELAEPIRAIAPGQSGVLYDGRRVLGGGVIASDSRARAPFQASAPHRP